MQKTPSEEFIQLVNQDFARSKDFHSSWDRVRSNYPTVYNAMMEAGKTAEQRRIGVGNTAKPGLAEATRARQRAENDFLGAVRETMSRLGCEYDRAWSHAKAMHPDKFDAVNVAIANERALKA